MVTWTGQIMKFKFKVLTIILFTELVVGKKLLNTVYQQATKRSKNMDIGY